MLIDLLLFADLYCVLPLPLCADCLAAVVFFSLLGLLVMLSTALGIIVLCDCIIVLSGKGLSVIASLLAKSYTVYSCCE